MMQPNVEVAFEQWKKIVKLERRLDKERNRLLAFVHNLSKEEFNEYATATIAEELRGEG